MTENIGVPSAGAPKKARNVLGLISIILAIVGFALAIIPLLGVVGWPLLIAALVLAIIGLTRKGQSKGSSIAGLVVSVVAMIAAPIIALGIFVGSVNESNTPEVNTDTSDTSDTSKKADGDDATEPAGADVGTRANPAPLGSEIVGDDWTVVINSVTFGAAVKHGTADEGHEFVLVNLSATYTGDDANGESPLMDVDVDIVTADGTTGPLTIALVDNAFPWTDDLFTGGTATGDEVLSIPSDKQEGAVLAVTTGLFGDKVFVATK